MAGETLVSTNPNVGEAVITLERAMSAFIARELVSGGEITDVLLDVRTLLIAARTVR